MKPEYEAWIKENITPETAFAKCAEWSAAMQTFFPELKRVRGHVMLSTGIERSHWWCVAEDGSIVDPTKSQFGLPYFGAAPVFYEEWDESQKQPTGKCPNCGGYCYDDNYLCSKACEISYEAYCNSI